MKEKRKQILNIFILLGITILVLYLALKDDFYDIISLISTMNIFWLLVAIGLVFGYWFFKTLSMYNIVSIVKKDYTFKKLFRLTLVTHFFHAVTPFASGGQPYEVYEMNKHGISVSQSTNISIQSFIVYQIALVILGIIAIVSNYFMHIFKSVVFLRQLVTIGFAINMFVVILLFFLSFNKKSNRFLAHLIISWAHGLKIVKNKEKTYEKWNDYIEKFHNGAKILMKNKKSFIGTILINFLGLVSLYLVPLAVSYSLGINSLNGLLSIVSCSYVMIVGSFVPIPGGTGGLEYSFLQFFGNFIAGPSLTALMLIWRFVTYYFGMILGAIIFNFKEKR